MAGGTFTKRDVVGWFGSAAAAMALPAFVGWFTGSFQAVAAYASDQTRMLQLVSWSAAFLLSGVSIGIVIRHLVSIRQLKNLIERNRSEHAREIAEKDAEIDRLRRNIVGLEDVDRIMRHLPPNFYDILSAIYANGGSMVLPLSGELRGLVNRHVLNGDEGPAGVYTWSLPPGVMDYFDQRVGRPIVAGRPSARTGA